jgi:hypothetical protein
MRAIESKMWCAGIFVGANEMSRIAFPVNAVDGIGYDACVFPKVQVFPLPCGIAAKCIPMPPSSD